MSEEAEGAGTAAEAAKPDLATELASLRERLLQAELRTEAARAGMVDLDGVKLIDASTLTLNPSGSLVDGAAVMRTLRVAKPWLFGVSSSSAAAAPRAKPAEPKTAMQMSVEEWKAARAELLRRK